jgi:hypothetical protein
MIHTPYVPHVCCPGVWGSFFSIAPHVHVLAVSVRSSDVKHGNPTWWQLVTLWYLDYPHRSPSFFSFKTEYSILVNNILSFISTSPTLIILHISSFVIFYSTIFNYPLHYSFLLSSPSFSLLLCSSASPFLPTALPRSTNSSRDWSRGAAIGAWELGKNLTPSKRRICQIRG